MGILSWGNMAEKVFFIIQIYMYARIYYLLSIPSSYGTRFHLLIISVHKEFLCSRYSREYRPRLLGVCSNPLFLALSLFKNISLLTLYRLRSRACLSRLAVSASPRRLGPFPPIVPLLLPLVSLLSPIPILKPRGFFVNLTSLKNSLSLHWDKLFFQLNDLVARTVPSNSSTIPENFGQETNLEELILKERTGWTK
jgi:hypothetical protein